MLRCAFLAFVLCVAASAQVEMPLPGSFHGTLPCADCGGIDTRLTLLGDGTYLLEETYLKGSKRAPVLTMGKWSFDKTSLTLSLDRGNGQARKFSSRNPEHLRALDLQGKEIQSKLPYELRRQPKEMIPTSTQTFEGKYFFLADSAAFTECASGLRMPVRESDAATSAHKKYMEVQKKGGEPVYMVVRGRLTARLGERNEPVGGVALQIQSVERVEVDGDCGQLRSRMQEPSKDVKLAGTKWRITSMGEDSSENLARTQLQFVSDTRVSGTTGCNRFNGMYQQDGESLSFKPLAMTRRACPGPLMEQENRISKMFGAVTAIKREGDRLELRTTDGPIAVLQRIP
jgi:copper homeostasis protein (lipoprotein)